MIDLTLLREQTDKTLARLRLKDPQYDGRRLVDLDKELRLVRSGLEQLRSEKNLLAKEGRAGQVSEELRNRSKQISLDIAEAEARLKVLDDEFHDLYIRCPNLPAEDVPEGGKEHNRVIKSWGEKPHFSFTPRNHTELNEKLGWFDFASAAAITGSNFVWYKPEGAKLVYALALFMLNEARRFGYELQLPPYLVNRQSLEGAGQYHKFQQGVYTIGVDGFYLTPTAEVNLTNLYRNTVFSVEDLPRRLTSWTSCFRREAGTYGATERGLIRIHQFEKVELYTLATPAQAPEEHERMLACAEGILQKLGLQYRISLLAMQDSSFAAAKTYDIEVWMPGQNSYYEVSSVSNCTDFQSRRCNIKYQTGVGKELVYTLNGSSLALPRLMVALMEQYQQADGSVQLPTALRSVTWEL